MSGSILLLACVVFSASASIFLKLGTSSLTGQLEFLPLVRNPMIWIGGICYSAAFLGYIYVLRFVPLSLAQPVITAGVSLVTALIAVFFFREQMLPLNWAGLSLVCFGLFFLFFGRN